jgi:hypothetical protein
VVVILRVECRQQIIDVRKPGQQVVWLIQNHRRRFFVVSVTLQHGWFKKIQYRLNSNGTTLYCHYHSKLDTWPIFAPFSGGDQQIQDLYSALSNAIELLLWNGDVPVIATLPRSSDGTWACFYTHSTGARSCWCARSPTLQKCYSHKHWEMTRCRPHANNTQCVHDHRAVTVVFGVGRAYLLL